MAIASSLPSTGVGGGGNILFTTDPASAETYGKLVINTSTNEVCRTDRTTVAMVPATATWTSIASGADALWGEDYFGVHASPPLTYEQNRNYGAVSVGSQRFGARWLGVGSGHPTVTSYPSVYYNTGSGALNEGLYVRQSSGAGWARHHPFPVTVGGEVFRGFYANTAAANNDDSIESGDFVVIGTALRQVSLSQGDPRNGFYFATDGTLHFRNHLTAPGQWETVAEPSTVDNDTNPWVGAFASQALATASENAVSNGYAFFGGALHLAFPYVAAVPETYTYAYVKVGGGGASDAIYLKCRNVHTDVISPGDVLITKENPNSEARFGVVPIRSESGSTTNTDTSIGDDNHAVPAGIATEEIAAGGVGEFLAKGPLRINSGIFDINDAPTNIQIYLQERDNRYHWRTSYTDSFYRIGKLLDGGDGGATEHELIDFDFLGNSIIFNAYDETRYTTNVGTNPNLEIDDADDRRIYNSFGAPYLATQVYRDGTTRAIAWNLLTSSNLTGYIGVFDRPEDVPTNQQVENNIAFFRHGWWWGQYKPIQEGSTHLGWLPYTYTSFKGVFPSRKLANPYASDIGDTAYFENGVWRVYQRTFGDGSTSRHQVFRHVNSFYEKPHVVFWGYGQEGRETGFLQREMENSQQYAGVGNRVQRLLWKAAGPHEVLAGVPDGFKVATAAPANADAIRRISAAYNPERKDGTNPPGVPANGFIIVPPGRWILSGRFHSNRIWETRAGGGLFVVRSGVDDLMGAFLPALYGSIQESLSGTSISTAYPFTAIPSDDEIPGTSTGFDDFRLDVPAGETRTITWLVWGIAVRGIWQSYFLEIKGV